jgi:aquaporin Z
MMRKLVLEGIGTFFLVFTIGQVVIEPGAGALAPIAIGGVLAIMVYAGGHISGAHYNPAVTLAVFLRRRATAAELVGYPIAQIIGALLAAVTVGWLKGDAGIAPLAPPAGASLLVEFLATFALAFVVLNVATARGTQGNSYFGLAIGGTVMVMAWAVGGISGGAFNPAVAVGITALGLVSVGSLWIYLLANLAGGAAAALLFNALDLGEDRPITATAAEQAALAEPAATH